MMAVADFAGLEERIAKLEEQDRVRHEVWQAGGPRSGDVGFGGDEMALEALEKPPFGVISST